MDLWIASGMFLLGAGVGALTTASGYIKQIRQLNDLLEATHTNPQTEEDRKSDEHQSA